MTKSKAPASPVKRRRTEKGQVAVGKLKSAVIAQMADKSYHQLRIADVTRSAGVATGLFYHYFKDMRAIVDEVLDEFIARFEAVEEIEKGVDRGDWFGRILMHYRLAVGTYAHSPGVMRCVREISAQDADFRERWQASYNKQLHWLIRLFPRLFPGNTLSLEQTEVVVYALSSIGDSILYSRYIDRDGRFTDMTMDEDELAEWLAVIFYRGLFASNPIDDSLHLARGALSLKRVPLPQEDTDGRR